MTFETARAGVSKFFVLTTVLFRDHGALQADLQELRHDLAAEGYDLRRGFHASEDPQRIRDRVFDVLSRHDFCVDATVFEKAKANPSLRRDEVEFYGSAWFLHLRQVLPSRCLPAPEVLVVAAEINVSAKREAYLTSIRRAMRRVSPETAYEAAFWPASSDLCVQAADYCSWAIFRKWERGDLRSYRLIAERIDREYDMFASGGTRYF